MVHVRGEDVDTVADVLKAELGPDFGQPCLRFLNAVPVLAARALTVVVGQWTQRRPGSQQ